MARNDRAKCLKWANFCSKISNLKVVINLWRWKYIKNWALEEHKCPNTSYTTSLQFWKSSEYDFFDPHNGQKWPLKTAKMSKFLTNILKLRVIYHSFDLRIHTVGQLMSKIMPKHILNNSKKTSNPKMVKHRCQFGKLKKKE